MRKEKKWSEAWKIAIVMILITILLHQIVPEGFIARILFQPNRDETTLVSILPSILEPIYSPTPQPTFESENDEFVSDDLESTYPPESEREEPSGEQETRIIKNDNGTYTLIWNGMESIELELADLIEVAESLGELLGLDLSEHGIYIDDIYSDHTTELDPTLEPESPSESIGIRMSELDNIASPPQLRQSRSPRTDNFGNVHEESYVGGSMNFQSHGMLSYTAIIGSRFSRFHATFFIPQGEYSNRTAVLRIFLDNEEYTSFSLTKTDRPIPIDIDVSNRDIFTIEIVPTQNFGGWGIDGGIGDGIFIP